MNCQLFNQFLSTFKPYMPMQKSRCAYQVQNIDRIDYPAHNIGEVVTSKGRICFYRKPGEFVQVGDYIELINLHYVLHWSRQHFEGQNLSAHDTVIKHGDLLLEVDYAGQPKVSCHVIKIKDRYFRGIENGRVLTAPIIQGATRFCRFHDEKNLQKTLTELAARKKKTQVLEVGYWSREFAEVQGGAL
jgi:hypothetical protein